MALDDTTRRLLSGGSRYLIARGDYQAAATLDQAMYDRDRRVLGDDHPDTMNSAGNLAGTCTRWGTSRAPAPSTRTPWPAAAGSWATTTPTP